MEKLALSAIAYYYKSDQDICDDYELDSWVEDVVRNELAWQDEKPRCVPEKLTAIDQLIS
ncbi:unnamed protein product [Clavelina lepadiformis]|uniref:Lipoxygenase domain-containing protein n=1 Tax=Clavelina lepadiformis TaxID=159417 RepID=A0ABP0GEU2_CLALP